MCVLSSFHSFFHKVKVIRKFNWKTFFSHVHSSSHAVTSKRTKLTKVYFQPDVEIQHWQMTKLAIREPGPDPDILPTPFVTKSLLELSVDCANKDSNRRRRRVIRCDWPSTMNERIVVLWDGHQFKLDWRRDRCRLRLHHQQQQQAVTWSQHSWRQALRNYTNTSADRHNMALARFDSSNLIATRRNCWSTYNTNCSCYFTKRCVKWIFYCGLAAGSLSRSLLLVLYSYLRCSMFQL